MVETSSFSIGGVITLVVVALLAGAMLPPAINSATSADFSKTTDSFTLAEGEVYNLTDQNTTVTLDSVNATTNESTWTLEDTDVSQTSTVTLLEGNNSSVTLDGNDYLITATNIDTVNLEATATVEYDNNNDTGTSQTIWGMVPLFIVLAVALLFIGFATQAKGKLGGGNV